MQIIQASSYGHIGGVWTGAPIKVCKASAYGRTWIGDVSGKNYRFEVHSASGNNMGSLTGNSETKAGTTWTGSNAYVDYNSVGNYMQVNTGDIVTFTDTSETADGSNFIKIYFESTNTDLDYGVYSTTAVQGVLNTTLTPSFRLYEWR